MSEVEAGILELTKKLMAFKTTKDNHSELRKCVDFVASYFDSPEFVVARFEKNGKPSMVVSFDGSKKPEILLNGHVDVVEAPDAFFAPKTENGRLYGRGSCDMKAGVACLMKAFKDLASWKEKPSTALMIVSDEELGGYDGSAYLFNEIGYEPRFALAAEPNTAPTGGLEVCIRQKGVLWVKVSAKGVAAHSSKPWEGVNAIESLMEKFKEIKCWFPGPKEEAWVTTLNLGKMSGGDAVNKVADHAEMFLDVRFVEGFDSKEFVEKVKALGGVDVEVLEEGSMLENDEKNKYIQLLKKACERVTGKECALVEKFGASDMRFLTANGIPAVVFGSEGKNLHSLNEYATIAGMGQYYEVLMEFLRGLPTGN